jgi:hypothetical protein
MNTPYPSEAPLPEDIPPVNLAPDAPPDEPPGNKRAFLRKLIWQKKIGPAFWTVASVFSLGMNIALLVVLIVLSRQLFALKGLISQQLVGGLHDNFVLMDQARIQTTVKVNTTIPVQFDLPVNTSTVVTLTKNTRIRAATVSLSTGGLSIRNAPTNIVLPAGTQLPIELNIVVPVDTTVPVELIVPVDIPMNQTELHEPFIGLQNVVSPYSKLLGGLPDSWADTPLCEPNQDWLCAWLTGQ